MDKTISRILQTLSGLVLLYLGVVVVASVTQLANAADRIYLGMGQPVFWLLITALLLLFIAPIAYYFKLPKPLIPPTDSHQPEYDEFLTELRTRMQRNPRLQGMPLGSNDEVPAALDLLALEANRVVRETAGAVFVGTAVMQNGRLDGMIVMATQVRMVWRIARIYRQRPSPREMLYLYSNVGAAALMADSIQEIDFSELATPLVASVIPSLKGAIPGLQGIASLLVNSIANGSANAFLTLRVGIVARQYCESLTTPSRMQVRQSATIAALALVSTIAQENGEHLVQSSWGAVRGALGEAMDSTVQGMKAAADKVVDVSVSSAQAVGGAVDSTVQGMRAAADKLVDVTVSSAKAVGGAVASSAQDVKKAAGALSSRKARVTETDQKD